MLPATPPPNFDMSTLDAVDRACVDRMEYFNRFEFAYHDEHATKTATIGMVVESSPVAMLGWWVVLVLRPSSLSLFLCFSGMCFWSASYFVPAFACHC
jgi:hypothetical protein